MAMLSLCASILSFTIGALAADSPIQEMAQWSPTLRGVPSNSSLLDEVAPLLGDEARESLEERLPGFITALHPMYTSTPKNEFGRLGHSAVRYTVNRLFVQRHGWFVNGIYEGQGSKQLNETSVTDALLQYVPPRAQHAFEARLSNLGLDETEVALLGAIIEHVIFEDAVRELEVSFNTVDIDLESTELRADDVDVVLDMHMSLRLTGLNKELAAGKDLLDLQIDDMEQVVLEMYPRWPLTKQFLRELREEKMEPGRTAFDFAAVADIVREIEGRWARWSAMEECHELKGKLLALEEGSNTGCVRLSDFYRRSLDPKDGWQFKENPAYLRQLGALDESEPANPRVIIPNYINMPGNCVPSSKFYMACCISECESLQVQIESALQAPEGTPHQIAAVVKALPAKSAPDHTVLSNNLILRLFEIADVHGGVVPLHSRLFAQWLHFAYPRECTFPHVAGTTNPQAPDLLSMAQIVDDVTVQQFIEAGKSDTPKTDSGTCMHWRHEEEIFVPTLHPATTSLADLEKDASVWASLYMVSALASASLMLARFLQGAWSRRASKLTAELPILV